MTSPSIIGNDSSRSAATPDVSAKAPTRNDDANFRVAAQSAAFPQLTRLRWHWSLFAALLLIAAMMLNWGSALLFGILDTIGNFQWQLVFLCSCLAVYQIFARRPWWAVVILAFIALPMLRMAALYLPGSQPPPGKQILRILTLNVQEPSENYPAVARLIDETDADVINLIEFSPVWMLELREALSEYPWHIGPVNGNMIYSRLPIERFQSRHMVFDAVNLLAAAAKLEFDGQRVLILNTHPTSPTTLERLRERDGQIGMLANPVAYLPTWWHVVVVGDFNATTHCHSLRSFLSHTGLRDTRQGFGLQSSWPSWFWPMAICIDQAFVSSDVHVHRRTVGPSIGSDHLPVVLELSFGEHGQVRREQAGKTQSK